MSAAPATPASAATSWSRRTTVAGDLWDALLAAGEEYGIAPCGLGARDTLRTEMGYPLHGQDVSMDITPVQARLGWAVGWTSFTPPRSRRAHADASPPHSAPTSATLIMPRVRPIPTTTASQAVHDGEFGLPPAAENGRARQSIRRPNWPAGKRRGAKAALRRRDRASGASPRWRSRPPPASHRDERQRQRALIGVVGQRIGAHHQVALQHAVEMRKAAVADALPLEMAVERRAV